jgi:copper chaperone
VNVREFLMRTTSEFQVTGMTCGHCEMSVREEVSTVPGVEQIDVSARTGKLVVTAAEPVDDDLVVSAVEEAGYRAVRTS